MSEPAEPEWIDASKAARLLSTNRARVVALAAEGLIATRSLPGVRARFLRADCERLARESVRPAGEAGPAR